VENVETRNFLENATKHLIRLTNSKIEAIACDLHPKFITTRLAQDLAVENDWQLVQVQHHYAHIAGLMAEHDAKEIIGICCDGYGYGTDGKAWGGEILLGTQETHGFKRIAHLEEQPLIGGDLATRYPFRIALGMLYKNADMEEWLQKNKKHFPHGQKEIEIILHQLDKGNNITYTTSCGRVLDAVSAVLGLCHERTYEGEPAMKLESAAIKGRDILGLKPIIDGSRLATTQLLMEIFEKREKHPVVDLAYSAHAYIAKGLASLAIEKASEYSIRTIGFSGGTACNQILASIIRETVEAAGLQFLVHMAVPPGDGGLSFGQAVVGGFFNS
jgi:hydrogenase maturation protein HypF